MNVAGGPMAGSPLFRKIKAALDSEDIEGLLAIGSPADEYNGEASLIEDGVARLLGFGKAPLNVAQVEQVVATVWDGEFGPFGEGDLDVRRAAFSSVARKIIAPL
jgi:hypothetical protein